VSTAGYPLSDRQLREVEYHKDHAAKSMAQGLSVPCDLLAPHRRRWWNASWAMYTRLLKADLRGKNVLVPGCGFGEDAVRLARMGARVFAFDLSPDMLAVARELTRREGADVAFSQMPAERLDYADGFADCIVVRDVLHHVDITPAMRELTRVAAPGAMFLANEVYSHSFTDRIRYSWLVISRLYPQMVDYVYGGAKPYITADERKLNEADIRQVQTHLTNWRCEYFSCLVTRLLPPTWTTLAKCDRLMLKALGPAAGLLAGRVLLTGHIGKPRAARQ
jgi:ubiquinone/menaquinone biosynthesis C-methylase UbiE